MFGDFQRVWVQRFPESALPAAWEEDVRANLAKHKQKVAVLREELEKEEFYVEYLETLLSDVEKHKALSQGKEAPPQPADVNESDDKDSDSIQVTIHTIYIHLYKFTSCEMTKPNNKPVKETRAIIGREVFQ